MFTVSLSSTLIFTFWFITQTPKVGSVLTLTNKLSNPFIEFFTIVSIKTLGPVSPSCLFTLWISESSVFVCWLTFVVFNGAAGAFVFVIAGLYVNLLVLVALPYWSLTIIKFSCIPVNWLCGTVTVSFVPSLDLIIPLITVTLLIVIPLVDWRYFPVIVKIVLGPPKVGVNEVIIGGKQPLEPELPDKTELPHEPELTD